ncbi:hypothetical protein Sste5346_009081 [Sporothrix stenoceras]|uniref:Uncharacterized protein n=1 Tax=Sporothrix stenoceras TaxID=5173 RepID=A0ABR3YLC1_9PEZI
MADTAAASPGTLQIVAINTDAPGPSQVVVEEPEPVAPEESKKVDSVAHTRFGKKLETWKKRRRNLASSPARLRLPFRKKERTPVQGICVRTVANNVTFTAVLDRYAI